MKKQINKNVLDKKITGRPKVDIDFNIVNNLCEIQCTGEEIAFALSIDYSTLQRRIKDKFGISFADYYKIYSQQGKISLRRKLFHRAVVDGNVPILIFLAKNYLGLSDNPITEEESNGLGVFIKGIIDAAVTKTK